MIARHEVEAMLRKLDPDCDYKTRWFRIACALKDALPDRDGLDVFRAWSRLAPHRYPKDDCYGQWVAITRKVGQHSLVISTRTLIHMARDDWDYADAQDLHALGLGWALVDSCGCTEPRAFMLGKSPAGFRLVCRACYAAVGKVLPADRVKRWPARSVVQLGLDGRVVGCVHCRSINHIEFHHWAPIGVFDDADEWPKSPLCHPCHDLWHTKMGLIRFNVQPAQPPPPRRPEPPPQQEMPFE